MKYVVCNLKNKFNLQETKEYIKDFENIDFCQLKPIVMPSNLFLSCFKSSRYDFGSQDISSIIGEDVTGEISGEQLQSMGVKYVLIGHSERRIFKKEINIDFINKIINAQENNIKIIYCVGENQKEKDNNETFDIIEKQIEEVLNNVSLNNIIIAYEPVWAVGTGKYPSKTELVNIIDYINDLIMDNYNTKLEILYGGSVTDDNIDFLSTIKSLDGIILGTSSDSNSLKNIIDKIIK